MPRYSEDLKEQMVRKMMPSNVRSVAQLNRDSGISEPTLSGDTAAAVSPIHRRSASGSKGTEIATLEHRRDKTRAIRQGMMQQLHTGRVRRV